MGFLALVGLPVLFVYSFGMSPCEDGPCNPSGARDFNIAAAVLLMLALLIFSVVVYLIRRRARAINNDG
jgi:hypothetical protein